VGDGQAAVGMSVCGHCKQCISRVLCDRGTAAVSGQSHVLTEPAAGLLRGIQDLCLASCALVLHACSYCRGQ
jgi:hypothetical protein